MQRTLMRTLYLMIGMLLALTALSAEDILSRQRPAKTLKAVNMDSNMGLVVPDGLERATFALG